MITYRLTIADMGIGGLYLGTTDELVNTQVIIDISEWTEMLSLGGAIGLTFAPPEGAVETVPYSFDGKNIIWNPTIDAFYTPGVGEITLMLIGSDGSIIAKKTNKTIVAMASVATYSTGGDDSDSDFAVDTAMNRLPHVTVNGRDMTIPAGIQEISVRGDSKSVRVVFEVYRYYDGVDLGMRSFFVEILNSKNQFDTVVPSIYVDGDKVIVTWEVQRKHAAFAGQVKVKLKATENGDYIWQTHTGYFTVADTFDSGNEHIPEPTLTAVEQALEEMRQIMRDCSGTYVVAFTQNEYGAITADKTMEEVIEASKTSNVVGLLVSDFSCDQYNLIAGPLNTSPSMVQFTQTEPIITDSGNKIHHRVLKLYPDGSVIAAEVKAMDFSSETDEYINLLIDAKIGVIENGTY